MTYSAAKAALKRKLDARNARREGKTESGGGELKTISADTAAEDAAAATKSSMAAAEASGATLCADTRCCCC